MTIVGISWSILKYIPYFNRFYLRLQAFVFLVVDIISHLVSLFSLLAELFVVTKPVELSQGLAVDMPSYNLLMHEKNQMEITIHDYEAKLAVLEMIAHWCESEHVNPDASAMKVQRSQLANSQRDLERLRRDYINLQNDFRVLEDRKEDWVRADVAQLRKTIESKDATISKLMVTITALEARPDTEKLKIESERARELQQKLDAQVQEATGAEIKAALQKEEISKLQTANRSLLSETKAAEVRAQAVALSHKKTMEAAEEKIRELEIAAVDTESQLAEAREAASATSNANATIGRLQQELEATRAEHREQFGREVKKMKSHLRGQYEQQLLAARQGLAEAAEAEIPARVEERLASEILAARKGLAEAAEAGLNARIEAARKELAEAAEADIESRVNARLDSRVLDALAERAAAEAALFDLPLDDGEFDKIAAECQQREDARRAEAASAPAAPAPAPASSSDMDTTMSTELPAAAEPVAANPPARKRATGRRVVKIPGLGSENYPQHVIAHAQAQAAAVAAAAFEAGKFFEEELPDINKPFQGELQRVEVGEDEEPFETVYMR